MFLVLLCGGVSSVLPKVFPSFICLDAGGGERCLTHLSKITHRGSGEHDSHVHIILRLKTVLELQKFLLIVRFLSCNLLLSIQPGFSQYRHSWCNIFYIVNVRQDGSVPCSNRAQYKAVELQYVV